MKTLTDVRASDLMRTDVVTLPPEATIREAVETLQDNHLGGIPVVDGERVVGFLSHSDLARTEHLQGDRLNEDRGDWQMSNPIGEALGEEALADEQFTGREDYSAQLLGHETVGEWMTRGVTSVEPTASLREVCNLMLREGVHRVVVIEDGRLRGIVSTTDIVRHVAENA